MHGGNSPPAAGGTGALLWLSHSMQVSPLGTIHMPIGARWPAAPGTWNWGPWNPAPPHWRLFWRAAVWGWAREWLPWRPREALLAGLILSESPSQCRLAPWWLGRAALVQGPALVQVWGRCQASPQMCPPHSVYQIIPPSWGNISLHFSRNLDCVGCWCWWLWTRAGCELCQECGWGCKWSWKGQSCVLHHVKGISQYSSKLFGGLQRAKMLWGFPRSEVLSWDAQEMVTISWGQPRTLRRGAIKPNSLRIPSRWTQVPAESTEENYYIPD